MKGNLNKYYLWFQENSFLQPLGHLELDLPEAPEKTARLPPLPVDPYSRYGPKAEIAHLFRAPEKRPPQNVSLAFLILTLLPFIGFLVGVSPVKIFPRMWHMNTLMHSKIKGSRCNGKTKIKKKKKVQRKLSRNVKLVLLYVLT
jgi:hypothetical protein